MSSEVAPTSGRPRPQSGGFRTFLSWLKRDERLNERSESVESISSGGSDRTVTSFAYLTPAHYTAKSTVEPIVLPPPGPPSDTYRKRIQDRDLRRHLERNLTLHRKYQLPIDTTAFDALSLPHERRDCGKNDRGRRATSELYERRAPYVPGKRRAPVPPNNTGSLTTRANAVTDRKIRKRPAPQPPINPENKANKENTPKNDNRSVTHSDFKMTAPTNFSKSIVNKNSDTFSKTNNVENKPERNFLKQIFEGKKRISVCDPVAVRLLPNISELDRQAAEILQMKMRNSKKNNNTVEVMSRLVEAQTYTDNVSDNNSKKYVDEKEELKKMLKEMKDSLPKRAKSNSVKAIGRSVGPKSSTSNASSSKSSDLSDQTLRIGSNDHRNWQWSPLMQVKSHKSSNGNSTHNFLQNKSKGPIGGFKTKNIEEKSTVQTDILQSKIDVDIIQQPSQQHKNDNLPVVTGNLSEQKSSILLLRSNTNENVPLSQKSISQSASLKPVSETSQVLPPFNVNKFLAIEKEENTPSTSKISTNADKFLKEDDEIRLNLIFELERYIVVGDEHGAANAAMRLAQLRLPQKMLSSSLLVAKGESKKNQMEEKSEDPQKISNKRECDIFSVIPNKIEHSSIKGKQFVSLVTKTEETDLKKRSNLNLKANSIPDVVPSCSKNVTTHDIVRDIIISKQTQVKPSTSFETKAKIVESWMNNKKIKEQVQTATANEKSTDNETKNIVPVEVWVEDREAVRGPINLHIRRDSNLGELRKQAELSLGIPIQLQRWIVGRTLCLDDNTPAESLAGPDFRTPFYLCLVEADANKDASKVSDVQHTTDCKVTTATNENVYKELMLLEHCALVPNTEKFECGVCIVEYSAGEGVVLKECVHTFCRECLSAAVKHCEEPEVACPATGCAGHLQEREIRALVSHEEYEKWLARGLAAAESVARHSFHCRTRDCTGWALCEPGVRQFPCPVCKHTNCVPCEAIHEGMTCDQHRINIVKKNAAIDLKIDDEDTKALLDRLIERGEALACPECNTIITKKWGCDWVRCSACKTEICWVTRGRRWGPGGRGDNSAGCRCGVDGKRCHPSCSYCH